MSKLAFNRKKNIRTEISNIGVFYRHNQLVFVKFPKEKGLFVYKCHTFPVQNDQPLDELLDQSITELGPEFFEGATTVFCLPFHQTVKQQVNFPVMNSSDLKTAVSNLIERDSEEGGVQRLSQFQKEGKSLYNLTIHKVKKDVVEKYISVFSKHKITVQKATTEPIVMGDLAASKTLITGGAPTLVADLDEHHLKLYVFVEGELVYSRFVPVGYNQFVSAIAKQIEIDGKVYDYTHKAERMLEKHSLFKAKKSTETIPFERLFFQLRPTAEKIVLEIKKTINFFVKTMQSEPVQTVYTTGMFHVLHDFNEYLKSAGHFKVGKAIFKGGYLVSTKKSEEGYRDLVYFGLGLFKSSRSFNLLPKSYQEHQQSKKIAKIVVAGMIIWMFVMSGMLFKYKERMLTLSQGLNQRTNEIKILELKVSQLTNIKASQFSVSKDVELVKSVLDGNLPVEDILYDISNAIQAPMMLTNITVHAEAVDLAGQIPNASGQRALIEFVEKMEKLPYIKQVVFDTTTLDDGIMEFDINGAFQP